MIGRRAAELLLAVGEARRHRSPGFPRLGTRPRRDAGRRRESRGRTRRRRTPRHRRPRPAGCPCPRSPGSAHRRRPSGGRRTGRSSAPRGPPARPRRPSRCSGRRIQPADKRSAPGWLEGIVRNLWVALGRDQHVVVGERAGRDLAGRDARVWNVPDPLEEIREPSGRLSAPEPDVRSTAILGTSPSGTGPPGSA